VWHYQWMILNEFLPLFVGPALVNDIVDNGRRFYQPAKGEAAMPIEFQAACFRVGHTMVRPSYRANLKGDNGKPFFGLIFDPSLGGPDAGAGQRSWRPAQRLPCSEAVHRLADVLRLQGRRGQAQQADRHEDLHSAVHAAARSDREPQGADGAHAAKPPSPHDLVDALGAGGSRQRWTSTG